MIRGCRTSTALVLAALITIPTTSFAAENDAPSARGPSSPLTYNGQPIAALTLAGVDGSNAVQAAVTGAATNSFGQWGYGRRGRRRNDAAMTAIVLGAVGVIAGAAVLVYADRPECSANSNLDGCGYGTKVVGGAVLSAGLVGLMVGALTWR